MGSASRDSARQQVLAMVAGLPPDERSTRRFLVLQAYFDDSTSAGKVMVLAGYIASAENWAAFAEEWKALCLAPPVCDPFKMSRLNKMGQDGLEKARLHYSIIEKYVDGAIGCAFSVSDLKSVVSEMGLDGRLGNPYYLAWRTVLTLCCEFQKRAGRDGHVDVFFDDQTEKSIVLQALDVFFGRMPLEYRKIIRNYPTWRSDTDFMPLQAGDMLAWWVRKHYLEHDSLISSTPPVPWEVARPDLPGILGSLPKEAIRIVLEQDVANSKITSQRPTPPPLYAGQPQ